MKPVYLPILLCLSLSLSACGGKTAEKRYLRFTEELAQKETLSFTAQLRCEYEDRSLPFTLRYEENGEGVSITVLEPALIKGIRAQLAEGESRLHYEGVALDTGPLDAFGLCPMSALPEMMEALRRGYVDSVWEENGSYVAKLIPKDQKSVQIYLDKYTLCPVYAELISDGQVRVFARIGDWTYGGNEQHERSAEENLGGDQSGAYPPQLPGDPSLPPG